MANILDLLQKSVREERGIKADAFAAELWWFWHICIEVCGKQQSYAQAVKFLIPQTKLQVFFTGIPEPKSGSHVLERGETSSPVYI